MMIHAGWLRGKGSSQGDYMRAKESTSNGKYSREMRREEGVTMTGSSSWVSR